MMKDYVDCSMKSFNLRPNSSDASVKNNLATNGENVDGIKL